MPRKNPAPASGADWKARVSGRQRPKLDVRLPGFGLATGRADDRFRCSSETRDAKVFAERLAMVRDMGRQLWNPGYVACLKGVLDGTCTLTEVHIAYRRGDAGIAQLVQRLRAPVLWPLIDAYTTERRQKKPEQMRRTLRRFCRDVAGSDAGAQQLTTAALARNTIADFLSTLTRDHPGHGAIGSPVSNGTRNRYRSALGGFCAWLVLRGDLAHHPIAHRQITKLDETAAERLPSFSADEYATYLAEFGRDAVGQDDPGLRVCALLLLHTGADVGEVLTRRVSDIRWGGGPEQLTRVRYRRTKVKGAVERLVPVPGLVAAELRALIALDELTPHARLLATVTPGRVRGAHRRARTALERVDLRIKDLRHVAAIFWRVGGADLKQVQDWLGHATIEQTAKYAAFGPRDAFDAPSVEQAASLLTAAAQVPRIGPAPATADTPSSHPVSHPAPKSRAGRRA